MPKDRIENAIARASNKDESNFQEMVYEGKGPHSIGILIECATDNPTRTVANIRMYFSRNSGELGKTGSLDYLFTRKGVFKIQPPSLAMDELELELIDHGLEDLYADGEQWIIMTAFTDFGKTYHRNQCRAPAGAQQHDQTKS
jgi:transcriptional/translational regulatory protein YebC/TACO1